MGAVLRSVAQRKCPSASGMRSDANVVHAKTPPWSTQTKPVASGQAGGLELIPLRWVVVGFPCSWLDAHLPLGATLNGSIHIKVNNVAPVQETATAKAIRPRSPLAIDVL